MHCALCVNCALPLGLKTENRLRTIALVDRNMIGVLTAILYSGFFTACFAKDRSIRNSHDVMLMRFVLHFLNEPFRWDRRMHRVGIVTCVSRKAGHSTKAYPAIAVMLCCGGFFCLFSCALGGLFFFCFVLLPPGINLRNSRLAMWPDSCLAGKGLDWESFICTFPYAKHLLGLRRGHVPKL